MTLKERIKKSGIDRRVVAEKSGISYNLLNQYLNDFAECPDKVLDKILEVLKNN